MRASSSLLRIWVGLPPTTCAGKSDAIPIRHPRPIPKQYTIEDHNRHDRQLYDLFAARFAERAARDPDLPARVTRFRRTNVTFGKAAFLAREFRARYLP